MGTTRGPELPTGGKPAEGSTPVLTIADAPLLPRQLKRPAQRSGIGIVQVVGQGAGRNFSGEISLVMSTGTSQNNLAEKSTGFAYLPPLEIQGIETTINEVIAACSMQ